MSNVIDTDEFLQHFGVKGVIKDKSTPEVVDKSSTVSIAANAKTEASSLLNKLGKNPIAFAQKKKPNVASWVSKALASNGSDVLKVG